MKTIMLVCAAGMSTSLLVTKMKAAADEAGDEVNIFALPVSEGVNRLAEVDCILLGPQVRFQKKQVEKALADAGLDKPVDVIDMKDYGMMNGKSVYAFAKKLMGE
jgi:Phosphotransferase system cellobiose-specific component IIB